MEDNGVDKEKTAASDQKKSSLGPAGPGEIERGTIERDTIERAREVLEGGRRKNRLARLLPFLGPAFIASVAYVDPGNFATNIQSGAKFGSMLLWVILASNIMAMVIQTLSAKLGIATGMNLAEHCRANFSKPVAVAMWALMEVVAMATDLAEFLGAALGFNMLLGISLFAGAVLTACATLLILGLERYGFRPLEIVISSMVVVMALCYLAETVLVKPAWGQIAYHAFVPAFSGTESVILATGIIGATVMPHAIFLHSALTQGRIVVRDRARLRKLYRFEIADVVIAMGIAGLVNAAMLIMAAGAFHKAGLAQIATLEEAHRTLRPLLGKAAKWIFAVSLLVSGLSSSTVGTSAGQIIMQGFLKRRVPVWTRRLVTIIPSLVIIALRLDPTRALVISQVVLSFGLPFAIVPLLMFTRREDIMGELANKKITNFFAGTFAVLILALNVYLLYDTLF
ncbi:MAG: Nramp family divalent metal transporter [Nitrospiraceae bacterium]|nr:Nramp family divalent metal transporter [Nitrospiraceae bacterium]